MNLLPWLATRDRYSITFQTSVTITCGILGCVNNRLIDVATRRRPYGFLSKFVTLKIDQPSKLVNINSYGDFQAIWLKTKTSELLLTLDLKAQNIIWNYFLNAISKFVSISKKIAFSCSTKEWIITVSIIFIEINFSSLYAISKMGSMTLSSKLKTLRICLSAVLMTLTNSQNAQFRFSCMNTRFIANWLMELK